MKPQGGGSTPADDEELVIQTGCSGAASTFHFAGRFCQCLLKSTAPMFLEASTHKLNAQAYISITEGTPGILTKIVSWLKTRYSDVKPERTQLTK